jgi:hypothetical protein
MRARHSRVDELGIPAQAGIHFDVNRLKMDFPITSARAGRE